MELDEWNQLSFQLVKNGEMPKAVERQSAWLILAGKQLTFAAALL